MSNYYTLKNSLLYTPAVAEDIGQSLDQFGDIYLDGQVISTGSGNLDSSMLRPRITGLKYPNETLAAEVSGGDLIIINGYNFHPNVAVKIANVSVNSVQYISSSEIRFTAPAKTAGNHLLTLSNPDNGVNTYIPGIDYNPKPEWLTGSNPNASAYESSNFNFQLAVTQRDIPYLYNLESGSLPAGITLSSNGLISGTVPSVETAIAYTANISVRNYQNQKNYCTFTLTVNPDTITWNYPVNQQQVPNLIEGDYLDFALSATTASGQTITYTVYNPPPGTEIVGSNLQGTITQSGNRGSTFTATAAAINKSKSISVTFLIVQDTVTWNYPSLNQLFDYNEGDTVNIQVSVSTLSGRPVTYEGVSLPTGLSMVGDTITGTIDVSRNSVTTDSAAIRVYTTTGDVFVRGISIRISPLLDFASITTAGDSKNGYNYSYRLNGIRYNEWRCANLYNAQAASTPTNARAGSVVINLHTVFSKEGVYTGTTPGEFTNFYSCSLDIPHYPYQSTSNPPGGISVVASIRYLDGTDSVNGLYWSPPGENGSLAVSHNLFAVRFTFTKPISGWNILDTFHEGRWINNTAPPYDRITKSIDTSLLSTRATVIFLFEYNGSGRPYVPNTFNEDVDTNPPFNWSRTYIQNNNGANIATGMYLITPRYFSNSGSESPAVNPLNYQSDTYQNSFYFGANNDPNRFQGQNVGIGGFIISFY